MIENARRWRVLAAGVATGLAGFMGLAGHTASAEPMFPQPPGPNPATVTQPAAVTPAAAPAATAATAGIPPATAGVPAAPGVRGAAPRPVPQPVTPATSGTLADFFKAKGVKMEPQVSRDFRALSIVLPMPSGWSTVPDPNVPDAFAVIADRGSTDLYTPNAQVVVYKLTGDFDPREAISHGFIDSQQQTGWRATDMSMAEFNGFPSSFIEGSYRADSQMLNTSRRHVIATTGHDRYLVSLSVNFSAGNQGVSAAAESADAIVSGFKVAAPAPAAPPAAPAPAPRAPVAPPPAPGLPQLLGVPG
ncbi:LpqN/LpqT family lipoprotein [Mycobacterium sp. NPDC003449]